MKTIWKKRILISIIMLIAVTFSPEPVVNAESNNKVHGSSDTLITEDMLSYDIAPDYKINPETQGKASSGDYNEYFKKDSLQTVYIEIDSDNLNYMFQNAGDKPTVMAKSITIGDKTVEYVGLKTKGSYTLEHAFTDNLQSDRFSLTVNFGKYIKKKEYGEKQNFFGVDKISFNNFFFDKSMMKEYCSLYLMSQMGIPTPQFGLTKLYINGEYYGVYSMIESLDSSILEQYYKVGGKEISDYLCKPEGTRFLTSEISEDNSPLWEGDDETYDDVKDMLPTVEDWVKKLNDLSEGRNFDENTIDVNSEEYMTLLEQIIDVDEYLRYFAASSFLCQLDNMFVGEKNFGLYVSKEGKSLLIPWDYDLSFGCYSPVTAEATANYDLDLMYVPDWIDPTGTKTPDDIYKNFPLFNVLFQNEKLREKYHTYMLDCSKIMALGGVTSFGMSCEPNYITRQIEILREPLKAAAEEEVTERAGYMNGIVQPRDLEPGLINLSKIVSMRAVGVYCQVNDMETIVSGRGCNLFRVGNGQDNFWLMDSGNITSVDDKTGFFCQAEYKGDSPLLNIVEITKEDKRYEDVTGVVKPTNGYYKAYFIGDAASSKAKSSYRLYIPADSDMLKKNLKFYRYADGEKTELKADLSGNIYVMDMEKPGIVVIREEKNILPIIIIIIGIVLLTEILLFNMKRKNFI